MTGFRKPGRREKTKRLQGLHPYQNQSGRKKLYQGRKAGTTLVEMVVTLLVFGIMMTMAVGILSPAAKIFLRMQKLQYARLILDNTVQELRGRTREAVEYVKIYDTCSADTDLTGKMGTGEGKALEFMNTDGYVVLLSTEGCPETDIYLGTEKIEEVKSADVETGRLLERYFVRSGDAEYSYKKDGAFIARAYNKTFADRYYMGNYLDITFSYPSSGPPAADETVRYLEADVRLYSDAEKNELVVQDKVVLDFRYEVKRKDEKTAAEAEDSIE